MTLQDEHDHEPSEYDANWRVIRDDLDRLRADLSRLGEQSLADGQDKLAEELAQLRSRASSLASKVSAKGRNAHEDVLTYVRENPITSVGGAFGLGLLVAALFSRKS